MARWDPDAHGRLLAAALDLFAEQGYEQTTTAQIAQRAGLTRTTLFRLFKDKREILFQGQGALIDAAVEGIRDAPEEALPVEVLKAGITAMARVHSVGQQEVGKRLMRLLVSSPELQERAAFKRSSITEAIEDQLSARLGDARLAGILADVGVRSYYAAYEAWTTLSSDDSLIDLILNELSGYRAVLRSDQWS